MPTSLASEEKDLFFEAAPNLFMSFAKRSKEFMDQMKAIRSAAPPRSYQTERAPTTSTRSGPFIPGTETSMEQEEIKEVS